jgi:hypothetical protein
MRLRRRPYDGYEGGKRAGHGCAPPQGQTDDTGSPISLYELGTPRNVRAGRGGSDHTGRIGEQLVVVMGALNKEVTASNDSNVTRPDTTPSNRR